LEDRKEILDGLIKGLKIAVENRRIWMLNGLRKKTVVAGTCSDINEMIRRAAIVAIHQDRPLCLDHIAFD